MERPDRVPGWSFEDAAVLESQSRASSVVARLLRSLPSDAPLLACLERPGARLLEVGIGVGWLAIELTRAFPGLHVVGLDRESSVLERARRNVASAGAGDRITLVSGDAAALSDRETYDVLWLPGPFLDAATLELAARCAWRALVPAGAVIVGAYGADDPLQAALADLRTLRSGGSIWSPECMCELLGSAGLEGAAQIPMRWPAPIRLYNAFKPQVGP